MILLFGLNDNEIAIIAKATFKESDFRYTDTWQDILALNADLIIVNPDALSEEAKGAIAEFYREIEPAETFIILTKECRYFEGVKRIVCKKNILEDRTVLKMTVLECLKTTNRDVDFSRRLMLCIRIMRYIYKHPGVTTAAMAEDDYIGVSERSVKRYIDTLKMSGALIEYKNRGWYCEVPIWDSMFFEE